MFGKVIGIVEEVNNLSLSNLNEETQALTRTSYLSPRYLDVGIQGNWLKKFWSQFEERVMKKHFVREKKYSKDYY